MATYGLKAMRHNAANNRSWKGSRPRPNSRATMTRLPVRAARSTDGPPSVRGTKTTNINAAATRPAQRGNRISLATANTPAINHAMWLPLTVSMWERPLRRKESLTSRGIRP